MAEIAPNIAKVYRWRIWDHAAGAIVMPPSWGTRAALAGLDCVEDILLSSERIVDASLVDGNGMLRGAALARALQTPA